MSSHHAPRRPHSDSEAGPWLRDDDAAWMRRGQSLGELLLTSRKHAGLGWAAGLALTGGSLIVLALLGAPEPAIEGTINTISAGPP